MFVSLLLPMMALAGVDKLFLSFGLLNYWPALLAASSLGALVAHFKSDSISSDEPPSNVTALASRAVTLSGMEAGEALDNEALERELYRCLRSAMLSMAAIDGDIDPSEMIAISRVYANVTDERVDIGTLERQAQACMGKHEKMLDTLDCLAPYLHPEGKAIFLKAVLVIAAADGKIEPNEVELVKAIGEALSMDKEEIGDVVRALKRARVAS